MTSLIAGVGIFFCGTGLNISHGITALMHLEPLEPLHWVNEQPDGGIGRGAGGGGGGGGCGIESGGGGVGA